MAVLLAHRGHGCITRGGATSHRPLAMGVLLMGGCYLWGLLPVGLVAQGQLATGAVSPGLCRRLAHGSSRTRFATQSIPGLCPPGSPHGLSIFPHTWEPLCCCQGDATARPLLERGGSRTSAMV